MRAIDISYSYGLGLVFDKATFSIAPNTIVALVGPNGAGKSTLFKLLTQQEFPKEGKIDIQGSIAFVPQEVKHDETLEKSNTVREYLDERNAKHDYEINDMLLGLEMSGIDLLSPPRSLSGGQKTKLALIRALLSEPDILLLDEPTNFLDIAGKEWVMRFLSTYPKTVLLVSHDIALLDNAIDKVLAINLQTKKIDEYKGNYSFYLRKKEEDDARLTRYLANQESQIKRMEKSLVKLYSNKSEKGVRQRKNLANRIERLKENLPDAPMEVKRIKLHLPEPVWTGDVPMSAKLISKSFGENVILENVSVTLKRGERIAFIGPNGAGKSTFIKILVGLQEADSGEIYRHENLSVGYYSQEFETFDFEKTLVQTLQEKSGIHEEKLRPFLAKFLFPGKKIFQKVGTLSGGEKTRLSIAQLMLQNHSLLILDEPTTYLDILSQRIILDALKEYKGTMVIVSHTEEFISELEPTRALLLPENKLVSFSSELIEKVSII